MYNQITYQKLANPLHTFTNISCYFIFKLSSCKLKVKLNIIIVESLDMSVKEKTIEKVCRCGQACKTVKVTRLRVH